MSAFHNNNDKDYDDDDDDYDVDVDDEYALRWVVQVFLLNLIFYHQQLHDVKCGDAFKLT